MDERNIATPGDSIRFKHYFTPYSDGSGHAPNTAAGGVFAETAPMNIISYREVKLIEAEAANRTGNASDVTAFNAVRLDLEAQFEGGSFPATISSSGSKDLLKEILEEKYICLIG